MKIDQAVKAMSALAQQSRLEVFRLLVTCGHDGLPAGKIAEELHIPNATLSFHLKELLNAGLVDQRREGRSIIYSFNVEAVRALLAFLMEDCCQGRPELCDPKYEGEPCCEEEQSRPKKGKKKSAAAK